jgi:hypothetical protein
MPDTSTWLRDRERRNQPDPSTFVHHPPIYGLHGRFIVMTGEEKDAYAEKAQAFLEELQPQGLIEQEMALLFHDSLWCIKRAKCDEQQIFNDHDHHVEQGDGGAIRRLNQYVVAREKAMHMALKELRLLKAGQPTVPPAPPVPAIPAPPVTEPGAPGGGDASPSTKPPFLRETCAAWLVFERFLRPGNPVFAPPGLPKDQT